MHYHLIAKRKMLILCYLYHIKACALDKQKCAERLKERHFVYLFQYKSHVFVHISQWQMIWVFSYTTKHFAHVVVAVVADCRFRAIKSSPIEIFDACKCSCNYVTSKRCKHPDICFVSRFNCHLSSRRRFIWKLSCIVNDLKNNAR